jgi:hypothetical protein
MFSYEDGGGVVGKEKVETGRERELGVLPLIWLFDVRVVLAIGGAEAVLVAVSSN